MFSSNPAKLFRLLLFFSVGFSACGWWSKTHENANANPPPFTAQEIPSDVPFPTKEPAVYQTEIVVSTFTNNEKSERRTFIARSGAQRLTIFDRGEKNEISCLETSDGKTFTLFRDRRFYKEVLPNQTFAASSNGETLNDFLTTEWLNAKSAAAFETLAPENDLSRFRVRLNNSTASEILIFYDEKLKLPVRQEFYSIEGEQKTLLYAVELRNFQPQADESFFALPKDYRKLAAEEFDKIIRQEKFKNE